MMATLVQEATTASCLLKLAVEACVRNSMFSVLPMHHRILLTLLVLYFSLSRDNSVTCMLGILLISSVVQQPPQSH